MFRSLLILISITLVFAHFRGGSKHACHHDKIYELLRNEPIDLPTFDDDRNMQIATPRNMIISYDISYFGKLDLTDPNEVIFKENAEKALQIALKYFSDLIQILPKPTDSMKWDLMSSKCGQVVIPEEDKNVDKQSDLHLYVTYTDQPEQTFLAYAGWCRFLKGLGPTHGLVNFNLGILRNYAFDNPIVFEDLIEIIIHEITHVLGFSGKDMQNWVDSNKQPYDAPTIIQNIRGINVTLVATPHVLAHAREYYNCTDIAGMPLENQGGAGSQGSHWELNAINNEIMNPSISSTQAFFTKFTTSLLRDTGFYYSINSDLEEQSYHGKNKGCSFINGACTTENREVCPSGLNQGCDFHYYAVSTCSHSPFTEETCPIMQAYSNGKCYDAANNYLNTPENVELLGVGFGDQSRCFRSNLSDPSTMIQTQGLCYNYSCESNNHVKVQIGSQSLTCTQDGEILGLPGWKGTFNCPPSLDDFCGYKAFCPNHCSTNGYCINNKCRCLPGFSGEDCSQKI